MKYAFLMYLPELKDNVEVAEERLLILLAAFRASGCASICWKWFDLTKYSMNMISRKFVKFAASLSVVNWRTRSSNMNKVDANAFYKVHSTTTPSRVWI